MKKIITKMIIILGVFLVVLGIHINLTNNITKNTNSEEVEVINYFSSKSADELFLSDIDYVKGISYAGWDEIRYDKINDGSPISLKIENNTFSFKKGIWAHADSQVAYDISNYNYNYFTAFVGLNTTSARGDGVKFSIVTSEDGKDWGKPKFEEVKLPQQEATFVKIDIRNAKYIILNAEKIDNNASDHAVFADAKLVNNIESSYAIKSADEYNKIIQSQYTGQNDLTGELEFNILKRELVQNVGQFTINSFYNENDDNKAVLDWLMSNQKALRYYILGGKPNGSYYNSLTELARLYRNYKEDFENKEVTQYGNVLGDLYLRMATSLSLTHSGLVGLWMSASTPENKSDSVRRYAIMKFMHKNNLFTGADGINYNSWFEDYTVEEMRYVMMNNIDDESILWFNAYTQELIDKEGGARLWPHRYISYVWPNYANPVYYAEENIEYFNELFSVKKTDLNSGKEILDENGNPTGRIGMWDVSYTIPGGKDVPEYTLKVTRGTENAKVYKVWMNLRNKFGTGAVCGGISKTGSNIRGVHGLPDAVVGQPGHAAHINYFQNSKGEGFWGIDNDVSGWAYTGPGGRSLLGWGNASFASGNSGTYIPLAQEVVNHNDTYEQSQKFVYLANAYSDLAKKEEMYRKALEIQPLHLEAWYGLINVYNQSSNKTEDDYYELAKEIAESLKYYPLPMYQMTNHVKPKLTSIGASYKFTLLQTRILKEASTLPTNSTAVLQPGITRLMGNFLLGQMDTSIATFSFDGEDAGKIVLSSRFDGNGVRWDYAIRGKGENGIWDVKDFKEVSFSAEEEHKLQLTPEEIASITAENDIYIHIVGVNYSDENIYKIDINESAGLPSELFASDLENKLLGAVDSLQWKYKETDPWKYYGNTQPELTGDKTIIVRMGATGTYLASKTSTTFTFTKDVVNNKRKYIPVSHLSLEAVSSEATGSGQKGNAVNALDANYNTRWHSAWGGTDTERYITVKLDKPYNISAVEFVPAGGGNGKIYDGKVWGSMDGENWSILSQAKNLTYKNSAETAEQAIDNIKSFDIDAPQKVQYVKIVADRTNGNWFTARAFNFYEDTTIKNVASFSFDGAEPGVISLYDEFKGKAWKYSIDDGKKWTTVKENSHKLSNIELDNINIDNQIKIMLDKDETVYTIKIKKGTTPEKGYPNDLENRPINQPEKDLLEWKVSGDLNWTSYADKEPDVIGNKTLLVRRKATGIYTASDSIEYNFTADNQPNTAKYIKIKHLAIHSYSSQSTEAKRLGYATSAIDGNPNTEWHTNYKVAEKVSHISFKLDNPRYISRIDYLHMEESKDPYGFMKNGKVYVSEDGENWKEVAAFKDVAKDEELKYIELSESVYAQYVKLEIESYDNVFASASMINLYEDLTKKDAPTASIEYSTKNPTNQNVTAKLVNPSTEIIIKNNNGKDTYTFTENGTFTFKFIDKDGIEGTATAKVDWIIKTLPNVTIEYSTEKTTNQNVTASISFDRDKTRIVDDSGNTIKTLALGEKYKITFTKNESKKIKYVGPYGNASSTVIKVDWIDKVAPIGEITYSTTNPTNKDVTATIKFNEENVKITSVGGKTHTFTENGEFTFEFEDIAGNKGTAKAKVDNIDRQLAMPTIKYSTTKPTNKDVVATVTFDKENVKVEGGNTHTFTENGTYEFKYIGPAGNEGIATAKVDWIDRDVPIATISYNPTNITNKDVTATITFNEKNVKITNNNGKNTYLFTNNGNFKFEFTDEAGNKGSSTAVVNIIDKIVPTAKVKYSTTAPTNKDVVATLYSESEDITITSEGGRTHTFTKNDTFTFTFVDKAGNEGSVVAIVNNINKVAPTAKVKYSETKLTNKDVIATLTGLDEDITITSEGGNTHTFTKNGTFVFKFTDKAGNEGSVVAKVDNIDKVAPTAKVKYSTTSATNKDVIATLYGESEEIVIKDKNHTFTKNGTFTFEFTDKAGNKGSVVAKVNNIDKVAPTAKVKYSTTELTNKDVIATLYDESEEIVIKDKNHTFTKNGTFTFEFEDKAGNKGTVEAKVENIDKVAPTAKVKYSTTELTKQDVIATLYDESEEITIISAGGNTHTFTKNGTFIFEFEDKAGNKGTVKAIVNNISKGNEDAKIEYSTTNITNKDVTAKITNLDEGTIITNNDGKNTYTFTENGTFTFEFVDRNGNEGSLVAIVNNIDKVAPTAKIIYTPTNTTKGNVIATIQNFSEDITILNNNGKNTYTFTKNGSFIFEISDKAGNITKIEAKVTWIDESITIIPTPTPKPTPRPTPSPSTKPVISTKPSVPEQITYKTYKLGKVIIKVPSNYLKNNSEFKIKDLKLDKELEEKLSGDNEYFELYIENKPEKDPNYTMTIEIDSTKNLKALYQVDSNNNLKEINYKKINDNQIEVETNSLGKYIISYEKEEIKLPEENNNDKKTTNNRKEVKEPKSKIVPTTIIIILIAITLFFTVLGIRENLKNIKK